MGNIFIFQDLPRSLFPKSSENLRDPDKNRTSYFKNLNYFWCFREGFLHKKRPVLIVLLSEQEGEGVYFHFMPVSTV